jgi:hypothetical protein
MLKLLLAGGWGAAMAIGGAYLNIVMFAEPEKNASGVGQVGEIDQVASELTGVPIVVGGKVVGYLVFRLKSTIDRKNLENPKLDIGPYLLDAAFRACYEYASNGIDSIRQQDIEYVTGLTVQYANKKLGAKVVQTVNLEQFNFVPADQVRGSILQTN